MQQAADSRRRLLLDEGLRYGRQLGRVVATHYQEIVTDRLYPGNVQLSKSLRELVAVAEETLE